MQRWIHIQKPAAAALLLDTYPDAGVAYSIMKIRTAYAGYCCQIRTYHNTYNIGFVGGVVDYASIKSIADADSSPAWVTVMYDQSGNNNHGTGSMYGQNPMIYDGTNILVDPNNGLPNLYFDGVQNQFILTQGFVASYYHSFSSFVVSRYIDTIGLCISSLSFGSAALMAYYQSNYYIVLSDYYKYSTKQGEINYNNSIYTSLQKANESCHAYINSSELVNWSADASIGRGNFDCLGGYYGLYPHAYMQEFIHWDSDQSANRAGIEANMKSRYGTP